MDGDHGGDDEDMMNDGDDGETADERAEAGV